MGQARPTRGRQIKPSRGGGRRAGTTGPTTGGFEGAIEGGNRGTGFTFRGQKQGESIGAYGRARRKAKDNWEAQQAGEAPESETEKQARAVEGAKRRKARRR